ncbi:MAG: leucine-rich repeat protein [Lachnospiraceae bacterium]|nr:leucine-rich repeat protein [Lachnospiraceae bacterium]
MIYPAEIVSIDYINYACTVNIPDLKGINDDPSPVICSACFSEPPGSCKGYKKGDKVWVAFIRGEKHAPVVLGFMTAQVKPETALIGKTLDITTTAKLPRDTIFSDAEVSYNSIPKIINKLKEVTNFLESNASLNSSGTPTTPPNTGTTEGYDHSLLEAALFSTITMSQSYEDLNQEYPLGRVLFVQNDAGIKYTLWSDIKIYPVASLATNIAEFSNSQLNKNFTALPGIWKVKTILNGAVLAQRCQPNYTEIPTYVSVMVSDTQARNCPLRNPETDEPLCYYWEQDPDVNQNSTYRKHQKLMSIATNKLLFKDSTGKDVLKNNSTEITSISLPDGTLLKTVSNSSNPVDSIAVLNLRDINLCTPNGQYCKFSAHLGNGLFCNSNTLEYIYLNDHYNNNVLNNYLFSQASALKEVYIPNSITKISENVFNGTVKLNSVLNMENSLISEFGTSAIQNTSLDTLYLPKTVDCVTFKLKSLGNHYNNNNQKSGHTKTLFVNSKLVLTSDYSGNYPKSCFYNYSGTDDFMVYINQFTLELVYSKTKEEVKKLIAESDIVAFFRTWYNRDLSDIADLPEGLDAYMVDGSSGYVLGSATDAHPVIVYNYKR